MSTRVRSHAKINLGLAIGPVRPDGYHALATVYQTLAIHDFVEVTARQLADGATSQISMTCTDKRVPCDERNTCWTIVERALGQMDIAAQVSIHINKRLPMQGGLGAGSANAAAALIGLEAELGITLSAAERLAVAAEVGSDVPLFLIGGTVQGVGRGEEVTPLPDLPAAACVLAVPAIGVSTPQAFRDWDRLQTETKPQTSENALNTLTADVGSDRLKQLGRMWASALAVPPETLTNATGVLPDSSGKDRAENLLLELVRAGIVNDFEKVVFTHHPSLRDILEILKNNSHRDRAAIYAALSGSGSALFGLYQTTAQAAEVAERLRAKGVAAFETRMISRPEYWRDMTSETR